MNRAMFDKIDLCKLKVETHSFRMSTKLKICSEALPACCVGLLTRMYWFKSSRRKHACFCGGCGARLLIFTVAVVAGPCAAGRCPEGSGRARSSAVGRRGFAGAGSRGGLAAGGGNGIRNEAGGADDVTFLVSNFLAITVNLLSSSIHIRPTKK